MNDELRSVLHAEAESVEIGEDSWTRLETRLHAPGSTLAVRAFAFGGIAIVLVVALVAGALWFGREDRGSQAAVPMPSSMPSRIVAVTADGNLVVLRARTGAVVRTLAHHLTTRRGFELAASAGGRTVLYTSMASIGASVPSGPACPGAHPIVLRATDNAVVGDGISVSLSPDGRWMAIGRSVDAPCEGPTAVTVTDLRTGTERTLGTTRPQLAVSHLSWAADSRHLAFSWANLQYVIDTQTATSLDDHVCVCPVEVPSKWLTIDRFGYLGSSNEFLGSRAFRDFPNLTSQAVVWGTDGVLRRRLFSWPGRIDGLASDRTGHHVLAVLPRTPRRRTSAFALYRWSEGQQKPTKIRDGVVAAAWIPDAPPQRRMVVAVTPPGHLVTINPVRGERHRVPNAPSVNPDQIAVHPDGRSVFVSVIADSRCGRQPLISVPLETGGVIAGIDEHGDHPTVSRDGRYLAYLRPRADCLGGNAIVRRDLRTGAARVFAAPSGKAFVGLRWMPDSEHVLSRVVSAGKETDTPNSFTDFVGQPVRRLQIVGRTDLRGAPVDTLQDRGYAFAPDGSVVKSGCGRGVLCRVPSAMSSDGGRRLQLQGPWKVRWVRDLSIDGQDMLIIPRTTLYRWRLGARHPIRIARNIATAAWYTVRSERS